MSQNRPLPQQRRGMMGGGPMGMGMPVERPKNARATLFRLLGYLKPHRWALGAVAVTAIASTVFSILAPRLLGNITTDLFSGVVRRLRGLPGGGVNFSQVWHLLALLIGLYIFSAAFSWLMQYVMAGVAQRTVYGIRKLVMGKLGRLPVNFFDTHPHGEILSRFVNDFDNISTTLQQSLTQATTAAVTFVGVVVMMLTINWVMTLVVAATLPLSFLVTRAIALRSQGYFLSRQRRLGELNGHVEEMYTGHLGVKAYGHEQRALDTFESINAKLYESTWRAQFITGIIMPAMGAIANLGYVLVSVVGGILVTQGTLQIGDILAFIQYARLFSQPINQLSSISNVIQSTLASAERVFEILDQPEEPEIEKGASPPLTAHGAVGFSGVAFSYQANRPLIANLTIDVQSGQKVAIVGPTGAGKTTLVNLLMRFYDVEQGKITVDGQDIAALDRSQLRRQFGMVLQDTWLFNGTIRQNIGYGRPGATDAEVESAAQAAHADHFIRTLPLGYDTVLNEEASNISQGQRQLLTIARAFVADPPMLILDEATSSVDTRTEIAIQRAMLNLMRGRTSFVIAHRLSTIRNADLILVMDHGQVVEQGHHDDLLLRGGLYAELYHSQFAVQQTDSDLGVSLP